MIIRFNPKVLTFPHISVPDERGAAAAKLGQAVAGVGKQITGFALQLQREEQAHQNASIQADVLKQTNTAFNEVSLQRDALQTRLVSEGREGDVFTELSALMDSASEDALERHSEAPFSNGALLRMSLERKFQPMKEDGIVVQKKLTVDATMRALGVRLQEFQESGQTDPIEEVLEGFIELQLITDEMVDNLVLKPEKRDELLEDTLTQTLDVRAAFLAEDEPELAADIISEEMRLMRPFLDPLLNKKLIDIGRAEREAGSTNFTATKKEVLRQISIGISTFGLSLEEVIEEGLKVGIDPAVVERLYSEHHNRRFQEIERKRTTTERKVKQYSATLRADAVEKGAKDRTFDTLAFVRENRRDLAPSDREFLVKQHRVLAKARASEAITDPAIFSSSQRMIDGDPDAAGLEEALLVARQEGLLDEADYEKLTTRLNNNRRTLLGDGQRKLKTIHSRGLSTLDDALRTTGGAEVDPVAIRIKLELNARLDGAMWGPEQIEGDFASFHKDPVTFINQLALTGRVKLDQSLGEAALLTIQSSLVRNLVAPSGNINTRLLTEAVSDGTMKRIDAERLLKLDTLIRAGTFTLPDGVIPKLPQVEPPPPEPTSTLDSIMEFFGIEDEDEDAPAPSRKPKKRNPFTK